MRQRFQIVLSAALLLALGALSAAQEKDVRVFRDGDKWVQETSGSVSAGKMLRLYAALGAVQVRGDANASAVTYTVRKVVHRSSEEEARREFATFAVGGGRRGEWAVVSGDWVGARPRRSRMSVEYVVTLPRETDLARVETQGGTIGIYALTGKVHAQTAGGGIKADDIGESLNASTLGGDIEVGRVKGDVNLNTAGGNITIGNVGGKIAAVTSGGSVQVQRGGQSVRVETAGGSIGVKECGDLIATTAGGTIDIGDVNGWARLESAGGGIRVSSARGLVRANTMGGGIKLARLTSGVRAETANGPIEAEFIAAKISDTHLATSTGDIVVYLPSDIAVTIKAAIELSNGHKIHSELPGLRIVTEGGNFGPRQVYGEGSFNGGGAVMKVHTSNGNIYFKRTKSGR